MAWCSGSREPRSHLRRMGHSLLWWLVISPRCLDFSFFLNSYFYLLSSFALPSDHSFINPICPCYIKQLRLMGRGTWPYFWHLRTSKFFSKLSGLRLQLPSQVFIFCFSFLPTSFLSWNPCFCLSTKDHSWDTSLIFFFFFSSSPLASSSGCAFVCMYSSPGSSKGLQKRIPESFGTSSSAPARVMKSRGCRGSPYAKKIPTFTNLHSLRDHETFTAGLQNLLSQGT